MGIDFNGLKEWGYFKFEEIDLFFAQNRIIFTLFLLKNRLILALFL